MLDEKYKEATDLLKEKCDERQLDNIRRLLINGQRNITLM